MTALVESMIRETLSNRRQRLRTSVERQGSQPELIRLLADVDAALQRMDEGVYGRCKVCREPIEADRLLADPLMEFCLDHLTSRQKQALEKDLEMAARIQRGLLPPNDLTTAVWTVSYHFRPHGPVSGDYCDAAVQPEGSVFFALGDVAGKGVAAALLMSHLHAMFRTLIHLDQPLKDRVGQASRVFCESTLPSHYATLICAVAHASGEVDLCNAGHLPALLVTPDAVADVEANGLPVGLFCEETFTQTTLRLEPADALVLYTDGLSEARNGAGEEYGRERLAEIASKNRGGSPRDLIGAILLDLERFQGPTERFDDLTVMVVRRNL